MHKGELKFEPPPPETYRRISRGCSAASFLPALFASYIRFSDALPGIALPKPDNKRWKSDPTAKEVFF